MVCVDVGVILPHRPGLVKRPGAIFFNDAMRFCHNTPGCDPAVGARIARPLASGCKAPRPTKSRSAALHPTQALAGRCGHRPLRPRLRPSRRGGLYGRPAPGIDSRRGPSVPPAVGARIARPLASGCKAPRRPQPPQHAVGRHAHMPPEPGALCSGPRWFRRPGCGGVWAPRPTKNQACSRSATLHPTQELAGRCGHRPLRTRPRPHRRGGLYARPAPGTDSRRRGAHCASAGLGLLGRAFFPYVFFDSSGSKYAFISPTN